MMPRHVRRPSPTAPPLLRAAPQPTPVPSRHCDSRVRMLEADARALPPTLLQDYAPDGFDTVLSDMLHFTRSAGGGVASCCALPGTHAAAACWCTPACCVWVLGASLGNMPVPNSCAWLRLMCL